MSKRALCVLSFMIISAQAEPFVFNADWAMRSAAQECDEVVEVAQETSACQDAQQAVIEINLEQEELDFDVPESSSLADIDIVRFAHEADDYDDLCDDCPVSKTPRWQQVLGNVTGAVVLKWNALKRFMGKHWNNLTNRFKTKKQHAR